MTEMAKNEKLDPVIGREKEIERVIQILSRRTKNNPVLIGEPGVGKTAIVEGLAQMIVDGHVPETLSDKRVVTIDMGGMVAGSKFRGEFEERMKKMVDEIGKTRISSSLSMKCIPWSVPCRRRKYRRCKYSKARTLPRRVAMRWCYHDQRISQAY